MQTILGANGTIGSLLARELRNYTSQIRLVSRNPVKINETDLLFPADLTDPEQVEAAVAGSEIVYLLVGFEYKLGVWQRNWPLLMDAVIDACKKHQSKLVFFDNVYLYAASEIGHMTESSRIAPPSKKGAVRKQIAERLLQEISGGKLTALIARAPDFYGPGNDKSFLIEMVYKNLKSGKRPNWLINANKNHSFIYTPDAAKATALLANTPDAFGQVWHLPTDKNQLTVKQLTAYFNQEMQLNKKLLVLPRFMIRLLGLFIPVMREIPEMLYQYDRDYFFDASKFENRFGFRPTTYLEGVRQIVLNDKK